MSVRDAIDAVLEGPIVPSFSRIGYAARRRLYGWEDLDAIPMEGKTALITGANAGLGFAASRRLAGMGARVLLVGRSQAKVEGARHEIAREHPGASLGTYLADLSSLEQVRRLAKEVMAEEDRLDVLVHNAGALLGERRESEDGHEMTFATMVLGPFALTRELESLLKASAPSRVIWVASGGMYTQKLDVGGLEMPPEGYNGTIAYARAKRAQVVLAEQLAKRYRDDRIAVHAMHPGWAETGGVQGALPGFNRIMGPILRTPEEGADTIVWLAAAAEPGRRTGLFWHDRRPRSTHKLRRTRADEAERRKLWELVERLTG